MTLPGHKTKIVCTIGPASDSQETVEAMIRAGMNVARINFSHGNFAGHKRVIETVRAASRATGRRVAIMADLPGPKMRIGDLAEEPVFLTPGTTLVLTTQQILGTRDRMSVTFPKLPQVVKPGDTLFLNDGFIQVQVLRTDATETYCRVQVGGELRSRKGLNLPGIDLGIRSFTERDRECLKFALEAGVDAVSQSFVHSADDIAAVREAASEFGQAPFVVAKIERSEALEQIDGILTAADAIMIARGDLGVAVPIERIAVVQKMLMGKANLLGKPVITATQMLESMTTNSRPTRAESTDVANAILDGTDCVMLSAESAMGPYPVEAVSMLAKIAEAVEPSVKAGAVRTYERDVCAPEIPALTELIAASVVATVDRATPAAVFVPTSSGATARSIARFRLPVWIIAVSRHARTCQDLQFSYGVFPEHENEHPEDWRAYSRSLLAKHGIVGDLVVLTEGPSTNHPETNNRMEIIDLRPGKGRSIA